MRTWTGETRHLWCVLAATYTREAAQVLADSLERDECQEERP